ncbi:MAG: hypothetical protein ACKO24_08040 [Leptolyngbyaceae cyanobacterium]
MQLYYDAEYLTELVQASASQIQRSLSEQGNDYTPEQVQQALVGWIESSIESLAEDAVFHCSPGQRPNRFNPDAFKTALSKVSKRREVVAA